MILCKFFYSLCFDYLCEDQSGGKSVYILLYYTIKMDIQLLMLCTAFSRLGCNITIRSADIGVRQGATYRGQNIRQQTKRVGLIAFLYCSYTSGLREYCFTIPKKRLRLFCAA
jgi:hypothetical protein